MDEHLWYVLFLEVSSEIAVVHKPVPGDILYVSPIKHTNILPFAPLPLLQKWTGFITVTMFFVGLTMVAPCSKTVVVQMVNYG